MSIRNPRAGQRDSKHSNNHAGVQPDHEALSALVLKHVKLLMTIFARHHKTVGLFTCAKEGGLFITKLLVSVYKRQTHTGPLHVSFSEAAQGW